MSEDDPEATPKKPRRWRRILVIAASIVLALLVGVEWGISHLIGAKLRATVNEKLSATLATGWLIYLPPYGVCAWDVSLVRDDLELLQVSRLQISLDQLPLEGKPIVISSLSIDHPRLNLIPGGFAHMEKPGASNAAPRKLSEMLRLNDLHVSSGRVTYTDPRRHQSPPTVWDNLNIDANLQQLSASKYNFHVNSAAAPAADASATGSIDVDELMLAIHDFSLKAFVEPEPSRTPLPAAVQAFLKQYRISGTSTITGTADIPLRNSEGATFTLAIALQDGNANIAPGGASLDHARASIVCSKQADAPVRVRLDRIDLAAEGMSFQVDAGNLELNAAAGTWSVADLSGHVQAEPPATLPAGSELGKLRPAGRLDVAASASGPFKLNGRNPWDAIKHEVIAYPRGVSFHPKGFARRLEQINGGEVRVLNGTLIIQELRGIYGSDEMRLRSARLPLRDLPRLMAWQEISAVIVFHPPLARYTPPIDKLFDAIDPSGPYLFAGSFTLDNRQPGPAKKGWEFIISTDTADAKLTDRQIALTNIRGDMTVTPEKIDLHAAEADVLGGRLQIAGQCDLAGARSYQFDAAARDVDMARLEERFRDEPPAKPIQGKMFIEGSFSGTITGKSRAEDLKAFRGKGQFEVINGDLLRLPVLRHISERIKTVKDVMTVGDAAALYEISNATIQYREAALNTPLVGLQGEGTVGFDGKLDLDVIAAPLADWREKFNETRIPLVSNVVGGLVGSVQKLLNTATGTLLYEFRVSGTINDVKVNPIAAPVLTDAAAYVFGKMLTRQEGERLIDSLKGKWRRAPTTAATQPQ